MHISDRCSNRLSAQVTFNYEWVVSLSLGDSWATSLWLSSLFGSLTTQVDCLLNAQLSLALSRVPNFEMTPIADAPTFSVEYLKATRDVQYQLVAAFAFLVWDSILTFEDEIVYVWRMRRCLFKCFYFYFRYILLAAQVFHLVISPLLSSGRTSDSLCKFWYRYMIFILELSLCMIEFILATRVFALFNRSRKVGIFLATLLLLHSAIALSSIVRCPDVEYFETCMLPYPQRELVAPQAGVIIVVQSITIGMTIFKHVVATKLGWGRTPLLSFLVKDAASNYAPIFLLCGISLAACGLNDLRSIAIMYWSISLLSITGCRLIVNMECFARREVPDDDIILTTHITM